MSLFVTTRTTVNRHGVFAEEVSTPSSIQAQGTGTVCLVGQFPWGPDDQVIVPDDAADRINTIAPLGMDRTGSGYMCQAGKAWPDLRLCRVLGSAAAKAQVNLTAAGPTTIATLVLKYKGLAGNNAVGVVSAASDGNANHFNLAVTVSNSQGSTTDLFENLDFTNGQPVVQNINNAKLVGAINWVANGRPTNNTYNLAGGADGVINSAAYLGTPGTGDKGLALAEGDEEIDIVFTDDPGNTLRAAVNAGLVAHQLLMGDRVCIVNGNAAQSATAAQTDAALYQSTGVAYADPWFYQRDEVDGTDRLVPPAAALATTLANIPPSTSGAWKGQEMRARLGFITRLEVARNASAGNNTKKGVCTLIKEKKGGYTFEAAVNTQTPVNWSKREIHRTRTGIYVAKSMQDSLRESVDAPNVAFTQNDIIAAANGFMASLKANVKNDPVHNVHIVNWGFKDLKAANPASDVQNGDFTLPIWFTTSAGMERLWLSLEWGPNVGLDVTFTG